MLYLSFFRSVCCSNSVDIPKRISSFFLSAQIWFGKPLKCHTSGSLTCLSLFLCRTKHRPNHHSCTPATVNTNKWPCSVNIADVICFISWLQSFYAVWRPDFNLNIFRSSSNNHGSWEYIGSCKTSFLSDRAIFHFHCGRKGIVWWLHTSCIQILLVSFHPHLERHEFCTIESS